MDNPCNHCDKANINKPTVLKCWKPCNKGKRYYECEIALIDILTGEPVRIDKKKGGVTLNDSRADKRSS